MHKTNGWVLWALLRCCFFFSCFDVFFGDGGGFETRLEIMEIMDLKPRKKLPGNNKFFTFWGSIWNALPKSFQKLLVLDKLGCQTLLNTGECKFDGYRFVNLPTQPLLTYSPPREIASLIYEWLISTIGLFPLIRPAMI